MNLEYKTELEIIRAKLESLDKDLEKSYLVEAASRRARVKSIELTKLLKAFRADSVKYFKEKKVKK